VNLTDPDLNEIESAVADSDDALYAIDINKRTYSQGDLERLQEIPAKFGFWLSSKRPTLFRDVFAQFGIEQSTIVVVVSDRSWIDNQMIRFHFGQPWFGDEPNYSRFSIGLTPEMMDEGGFFDDFPDLPSVTQLVLEIDSKTEKFYPRDLFLLFQFLPNLKSLSLTWSGKFPEEMLDKIYSYDGLEELKLRGHCAPCKLPASFFNSIESKSTLAILKLQDIEITKMDLDPLLRYEILDDLVINLVSVPDVATAIASISP